MAEALSEERQAQEEEVNVAKGNVKRFFLYLFT